MTDVDNEQKDKLVESLRNGIPQVRESWWVKLPGRHELSQVLICDITEKTVVFDDFKYPEWRGRFKKADVEYVEKISR